MLLGLAFVSGLWILLGVYPLLQEIQNTQESYTWTHLCYIVAQVCEHSAGQKVAFFYNKKGKIVARLFQPFGLGKGADLVGPFFHSYF